ncbi:hypothetical protein Tco_1043092 [Tanacetum coccineum]|uniref:Uncharacterized protein n=1 Tax=Tanacetum coccineum TaxID=301880 RepID=A0ABQ5GL21_9ASTR
MSTNCRSALHNANMEASGKTVHQYDIKKRTDAEAEVVHIIRIGIDNDIYKGKEIAKASSPPSESEHEKIYKPTNNNLKTSSNTKNKHVENTLRTERRTGYDRKNGLYENQRVVNVSGNRETVAKEYKKVKRVKDSAYHKNKMLLFKKEEAGIQLTAMQHDWVPDSDDKLDDQELEAHYIYIAKIQEVDVKDSLTGFPVKALDLLTQMMDEQNMTMEEYIKLEEEKAHRRGRVFNWKTATYGKIRVDDDLYDLRSMEAEFPAIVIDDAFTPQDALPCKSQVSTPVNDEIDFRISFDESDDEDYTIISDKNSFSYKMIFVNNLKMDSENDKENTNIPYFPLPKPTTSYVNDLDFFKDFENEFPAIVYNNAQTSKSDLLTDPILSPQHIDEFNLNDETSVSEYDEEEQNILYFNDRFPFNIIRPDDLKSEKDNNDNDIDIIQSSEGNEITHRSNMLMDTSSDKIDKIFDEESFVLELNVNIVTWIYLFSGMLLCFIMNLYVPFGIMFDPKRYYKDGNYAIMLRRPRYQDRNAHVYPMFNTGPRERNIDEVGGMHIF